MTILSIPDQVLRFLQARPSENGHLHPVKSGNEKTDYKSGYYMQVTFKIQYGTKWGESLAVVLSDKKYPLQWGENAVWSGTVECGADELADYWYVVMKDGLIDRTEWSHHSTKVDGRRKKAEVTDSWIECPIPGCPFTMKHQAEMFDKPGFRCAGTAMPVFSLRSGDDFGIGEFHDLRPLVDWAAATGQKIIQILPVNDTTRKGEWRDSYPYSPVSAFALHPVYVHLQDVGVKQTAAFKKLQAELNALPEIDYPRVFKAKMELLRKAYKEHGAADMAGAAYRKFYLDNAADWLSEYAQFCAQRDNFEPEFYCWVQWHLEKQFAAEADYARSKGISLKGDLPIGVSADSAEAYWHPELFNLDSSTGAPPDYFSADGQNWGFPTYNWEEMAGDDYAWWKKRLRKMSRFFDAFRIDHILGFFRIWEIPKEYSSGMMGHFNPALPYSAEEIYLRRLPREGLFHEDPRNPGMYQPLIAPASENLPEDEKRRFGELYNDFFYHRHDAFWWRNAMKKLPELLGATGMLACGEDLGMVPDCVQPVMEHERILSLEMVEMEKGRPWPKMSVCATSSHDMATLRMAWAEKNGGADMEPWMLRRVLWDHLKSDSMLAVFPLQDWVGLDSSLRRPDFMNERVNQPADPNHHWRFRFHRPIADLLGAEALNNGIRQMLAEYGRL